MQCHPCLFSPEKLATFFVITVAFFISLVHSSVAHYFRHFAMLEKNLPLVLWGPLFVGPLFGRTC